MTTTLIFKECDRAGVPVLRDQAGLLRPEQLLPWQEELNGKYREFVHQKRGEIEFTTAVSNLPKRYRYRVEDAAKRSPTLVLESISGVGAKVGAFALTPKPVPSEPWESGFMAALEERVRGLPLHKSDRGVLEFIFDDLREMAQRDNQRPGNRSLDLVLFVAYLQLARGSLPDQSRRCMYERAALLVEEHCRSGFADEGLIRPDAPPTVPPSGFFNRLFRLVLGDE